MPLRQEVSTRSASPTIGMFCGSWGGKKSKLEILSSRLWKMMPLSTDSPWLCGIRATPPSSRACGVLSVLAVLVLTATGCTRKTPVGPREVGVASWYGHPFDGRLTASGEVYDMEKQTAAHRTLPFGTVVRVLNTVNRQTTEVRINDRGPYVQNRIIDLSHAAAQALSMPGTATVQLEIISTVPAATRDADQFAVQIGAFTDRVQAEQLRSEMQKKYGAARLVFREGDQMWRVRVGMEPILESASRLAEQLNQNGDAFVVRVDPEQ